MSQQAPRLEVMRSQLSRVRGLGAAKSGAHHWWGQRVTSIALVPLTIWFVVEMVRLSGTDRDAALAFFHAPFNAILVFAFILASFHHLRLGMQVVIEDYARGSARTVLLLLVNGAIALTFLACLFATLKLAL